jgi:hypothetical protein
MFYENWHCFAGLWKNSAFSVTQPAQGTSASNARRLRSFFSRAAPQDTCYANSCFTVFIIMNKRPVIVGKGMNPKCW